MMYATGELFSGTARAKGNLHESRTAGTSFSRESGDDEWIGDSSFSPTRTLRAAFSPEDDTVMVKND